VPFTIDAYGHTPAPGPTTAANPFAANPTAIPSDCTIFVPAGAAPPKTGVSDLTAVKQALQSGAKPG
jgi:hypothetical protein